MDHMVFVGRGRKKYGGEKKVWPGFREDSDTTNQIAEVKLTTECQSICWPERRE